MTGVEMRFASPEAFIYILENPEIKPGTDGWRAKGEKIVDHAESYGESVVATVDVNVIVGGRDTRVTGGDALEYVGEGVLQAGADYINVGIIPTPGVSWIVKGISNGTIEIPGIDREKVVAAGVVATASHNPPADNGLKLFEYNGAKPSEDTNQRLVLFLNNRTARDAAIATSGFEPGRIITDQADRLRGLYEAFLIEGVRPNLFAGRKVVVDAGFGAAYQTGPNALAALQADVVKVACKPIGEEINVAYGATHPEATAQEVLASSADFGIALDGDADRVILISKEGKIVNGDRMLLILAMAAMKRSEPGEVTKVVSTVMRNQGLLAALKAQADDMQRQIAFYETAVGDTPVARKMAEAGASIGGEQSGHILLNGEAGDGVRAAIRVMKALDELVMTLDEAYDLMEDFPQIQVNVPAPDEATRQLVANDNSLRELEARIADFLKAEGIEGRTLIRESGTEALIRVMVELQPGHEMLANQLSAVLAARAYELAWFANSAGSSLKANGTKAARTVLELV